MLISPNDYVRRAKELRGLMLPEDKEILEQALDLLQEEPTGFSRIVTLVERYDVYKDASNLTTPKT